MSALHKGLLVGLIQVLIVGALGTKFMIDRATYPRVWMQTQPYDPDLPIRGRYVQISAVVDYEGASGDAAEQRWSQYARLEVRGDRLVAVRDERGRHLIRDSRCGESTCYVLAEPLAYFIPGHVDDPSRRPADQPLWVEVTVPPKGPPRPIQLGVLTNGVIRPLELR